MKCNVARAFYDEGNFKQAGELFTAFVQEYPHSKDVSVAAHLALDAFHNLGDFERLVERSRRASSPTISFRRR